MSGVQKAMTDLLLRLDKKKYDIKVICHKQGKLTELLKKHGITFIILPELRREIHLYYDLKALFKLFCIFKKYGFDIVHTHSSKPGILGRWAAKLAGVPGIVHTVQGFAFHEFSTWQSIFFYKLIERITGLVTSKLIIVNNTDYKFALKNKLVKNSNIIKVYNGISCDEFNIKIDVKAKKRSLNIPNSYKVVGSVGRLWKQKAPQNFIKAIPIVLEKCPKTMFVLVGNGPLKDELKELTKKLKIQQSVMFMGWRKDINEILVVFDVFVQTSLWEGLSLSIMEAMACRRPVVASNIKGNNELIEHGKNGFLVNPNDSVELANGIINLLKDDSMANKFGVVGKHKVEKQYNIETNVEKIENIYKKTLFC